MRWPRWDVGHSLLKARTIDEAERPASDDALVNPAPGHG